jgi:hypothetical protein
VTRASAHVCVRASSEVDISLNGSIDRTERLRAAARWSNAKKGIPGGMPLGTNIPD